MFEANDSWLLPQHSPGRLQKLDYMGAQLHYRQSDCPPICINPGTQRYPLGISKPELSVPGSNSGFCVVSTNAGVPGITGFKEQPYYEVHRLHHPYHGQSTLLPHAWSCFKEEQSTFNFGNHVKVADNAGSGPPQKGFMIFDRSGNQTQLVYSSAQHPVQHGNPATTKQVFDTKFLEGQAVKDNPPLQPVFQENFGKNYATADQSEMHEDTEEINALLYSSEDDYYSDDEVISTDHSPIATKRKHQMPDHDDVDEEVASSNGPQKRQKLLNGGYSISSPMNNIPSSDKPDVSNEYSSDAESSYAIGPNKTKHTLKPSKKEKVRMTLKILESIIPGAKGKHPGLVLDEAIDYLKSLKLGAMALGVNQY